MRRDLVAWAEGRKVAAARAAPDIRPPATRIGIATVSAVPVGGRVPVVLDDGTATSARYFTGAQGLAAGAVVLVIIGSPAADVTVIGALISEG